MPHALQALRNLIFAVAAGIAVVACSPQSGTSETPAVTSADTTTYNTSLDMAEFMLHVVEPIADTLWRSAGWINDAVDGYYELYPTDDEGWANVHNHGAMVVELGNMMLLPGRLQEGAWRTYAEAISTVGTRLMSASEAQNKEDLFQAGAQLYSVCTACHQAYNPEILGRFATSGISQ